MRSFGVRRPVAGSRGQPPSTRQEKKRRARAGGARASGERSEAEGGGRPRQTAAERAAHLELVFDEADEDNSGTVSEWVRRQFAVTMSGFMT